MDNLRLVLIIGLLFVVFLIWRAWVQDYGTRPGAEPPTAETAPPTEPQAQPQARAPATPEDVPQAPPTSGAPTPEEPEAAPTAEPTGERVHVRTDLLDVEIDTRGGDVRAVRLVEYPSAVDKPDNPFPLMGDTLPQLFVAQTGLLNHNAPNHGSTYEAERTEYVLEQGQDTLQVRLHWTGDDALKVEKVYTFHRDRYVIDLEYVVRNGAADVWTGRMYRQLKRNEYAGAGDPRFVYTYTGAVISRPENVYEKIDFDDIRSDDLSADAEGGWVAMIQHYFIAAWVPDQDQANHFYTKVAKGNRYVVGMIAPPVSLAPGETTRLHTQMFVGPKLQHRLEAVAPHLELTVDYGWLTFLSKPLFWLLENIHKFVQNWGWSIIILTILIKLVFYKLSETSYRSMAKMRKLQPRLMALKERHGDDKAGMQKAMMDLYKREKVNPLGGCLPILIQIPVFIALYWVLLESVELRHADFVLWIKDLSSPDPFFVLPLVMGGTMFLQQKLNPTPLDPVQAKVMMMLPIIFTVFFAFFPAGLVLYWTSNNVLSIAQQWVITRRIEAGGDKPEAKAEKS